MRFLVVLSVFLAFGCDQVRTESTLMPINQYYKLYG